MKTILFLAIILPSTSALAQGTSKLDCIIVTMNLESRNPDVIRKTGKELATFKVDNPGEEERILRFFRLPRTKWFVVASLYSTDESLPAKSGADSLDMELSLSRQRRRNIFTSPAYASAEMPYGTLDIGRVSMIVQTPRHRQLVVMECKAVD